MGIARISISGLGEGCDWEVLPDLRCPCAHQLRLAEATELKAIEVSRGMLLNLQLSVSGFP